jgi:hypothetical protein
MHCNNFHRYSITSSAVASSVCGKLRSYGMLCIDGDNTRDLLVFNDLRNAVER